MPLRDVVGHRRLVELIGRSVSRGALPPSLIFAGPPGVGKRLTATALAQMLNCTALATDDPGPTPHDGRPPTTDSRLATDDQRLIDACGRCVACARIARGVHPDVLIVEPWDSAAIKIEQVREAIDHAAFRPFEGRRRVVIIDPADLLVPPAQNALLKTLEEPPASSVFVLVTSRPDVLLPTIRSRCIRLWFADVGRAEVDVEARAVAHRVLARAAPAPRAQLGSGDAGLRGGSAEPAARRLDAARELLTNTGAGGASDREQLSAHLRAMASLVRDVEILATRADPDALANRDIMSALDALVPAYQGERGVRAFAAIDRALVALERNAGVKVVADWLVMQL